MYDRWKNANWIFGEVFDPEIEEATLFPDSTRQMMTLTLMTSDIFLELLLVFCSLPRFAS